MAMNATPVSTLHASKRQQFESKMKGFLSNLEKKSPGLAKILWKYGGRFKHHGFVGVLMPFLLWPVRFILCLNTNLFWMVFSAAGKIRKQNYSTQTFTPSVEEKMANILRELRENGVAKWEGLFSPGEMQQANQLIDKLASTSRAVVKGLPREIEGARDVSNPKWEHTREIVEEEFESYGLTDLSDIYGRVRTRVYDQPPELQPITSSKVIEEMANRYYGHSTEHKRILVEELSPSLMTDTWHVDCIGMAFKAMVLTSDCTMENGPLRYKMTSHRIASAPRKRLYYLMLRFGYSFSSLSLLEYRKIPGKVFFGTGKAGDVIFFDTSGVHSGSRCLSGKRKAIVLPRVCRNFQNRIFGWIGVATT